MLDYNSKNVNETWDEIKVNNKTDCEVDDAITCQYAIAGFVMMVILLFNLLTYIIGVIISNPTWVDQMIKRVNKDFKEYNKIQKRKDENFVITDEEEKKYDLKPKLPELERKLTFFKVFRYFTKLFWPFLIVLPHEYLTGTSDNPIKFNEGRSKSNKLWLGVKFVETTVENGLQLFLMLWLLAPYFACVSPSFTELSFEAFRGLRNILSFNYYDAGDLAVKCGKIIFAVISISTGCSLLRLEKPGLNFSRKMKSLLVLLPGALCQVIARLLSLCTLMLMEQSGLLKYSLFLLTHTTLLMLIKTLFETRAKKKKQKTAKVLSEESFEFVLQKIRIARLKSIVETCIKKSLPCLNSVISGYKRPILMFISCISSTFLLNNLFNSRTHLHYPKFDIISRCLFLLVVFIENNILCILPFIFPNLFPNISEHSFGIIVAVVNCLWIISIITELIYFKFIHIWNTILGVQRLEEGKYTFHTRWLCKEHVQKISWSFPCNFSTEDYKGIENPFDEETEETEFWNREPGNIIIAEVVSEHDITPKEVELNHQEASGIDQSETVADTGMDDNDLLLGGNIQVNVEVHEEIPKLDESNHSVTVDKTINVQDEQNESDRDEIKPLLPNNNQFESEGDMDEKETLLTNKVNVAVEIHEETNVNSNVQDEQNTSVRDGFIDENDSLLNNNNQITSDRDGDMDKNEPLLTNTNQVNVTEVVDKNVNIQDDEQIASERAGDMDKNEPLLTDTNQVNVIEVVEKNVNIQDDEQIASEREGCMDKNEPLTVTEVVVVEERNIQDDEQIASERDGVMDENDPLFTNTKQDEEENDHH